MGQPDVKLFKWISKTFFKYFVVKFQKGKYDGLRIGVVDHSCDVQFYYCCCILADILADYFLPTNA